LPHLEKLDRVPSGRWDLLADRIDGLCCGQDTTDVLGALFELTARIAIALNIPAEDLKAAVLAQYESVKQKTKS